MPKQPLSPQQLEVIRQKIEMQNTWESILPSESSDVGSFLTALSVLSRPPNGDAPAVDALAIYGRVVKLLEKISRDFSTFALKG